MDTNSNDLSSRQIIEKLNNLESRIARLEAERYIVPPAQEEGFEEINPFKQLKDMSSGSILESKVGEYGLSWLGNIVLFVGISFIVQYIQNLGFRFTSSAIGYISVAGIFILAHFLKKTYPRMALLFNLNAWLLLFYVTLRLHFFTNDPVIPGKSVGLLLITLVSAVQLFFSIKKHSALQTGTVMVLLSIIAVVSNTTHFMLIITLILASMAVILLFRFNWIRLFYLSIILAYSVTLIWLLNNPFMGNELQVIKTHNNGYIYLFGIAAIFSLVALAKKSETISVNGVVGSIVLNGLGFSLLLLLYVLSFFKDNYTIMVGSVSAYCLLYSVLLQLRSEWKITAALYALYGFVTLSVTLHAIYSFPDVYFLLAIQSLLVVSMAIWFRSKFIVVMNIMLFITLLIFYMSTSPPLNGVNISFSLVALITARILNWKKDRLTIKTDILRNIYLVTGFIMVLLTLYHLIPARYITLSWTVAAVIYFVLSILLKNVKYRYLALGTMIAAAFYLFIVDLAKIELVYRIIALMFLAIISIGLSIFYTRRSRRKVDKSK
ncbi:MAG: DUF2339 domain-containing protein [Chlorobi bacterium]|nr:DUF2339 domain-containing protein [Chlorobiota bacterium]